MVSICKEFEYECIIGYNNYKWKKIQIKSEKPYLHIMPSDKTVTHIPFEYRDGLVFHKVIKK